MHFSHHDHMANAWSIFASILSYLPCPSPGLNCVTFDLLSVDPTRPRKWVYELPLEIWEDLRRICAKLEGLRVLNMMSGSGAPGAETGCVEATMDDERIRREMLPYCERVDIRLT